MYVLTFNIYYKIKYFMQIIFKLHITRASTDDWKSIINN